MTPAALTAGLFCVLYIATVNFGVSAFSFREGQRALFDVSSRVSFTMEDPRETNKLREQVAARVPHVYRYDREQATAALARITSAMETLASSKTDDQQLAELTGKLSLQTETLAPLRAALAGVKTAKIHAFVLEIERLVAEQNLYVPDDMLDTETGRVIIIEGREWFQMPFDLKDARDSKAIKRQSQLIRDIARLAEDALLGKNADRAVCKFLGEAFAPLFVGLVEYDTAKTETARDIASAKVSPVNRAYRDSDPIIKRGLPITKTDLAALKEEERRFREAYPSIEVKRIAGTALLILMAMLVFGWHVYRHLPELISVSSVTVVGVLVWLTLVVARVAAIGIVSPLVVPLLLITMTVTIVYHERLGLGVALLGGFLIALAMNNDFLTAGVLVTGAAVAPFTVREINTRRTVLGAGVLSAAVHVVMLLGVGFLLHTRFSQIGKDIVGGAANGLVTGLLVTGLLPLIEWAFGVTTNISLLELSDLNHPLLKTLALRAPGTYHHSLIVGNLAESAANAIGANPLLARVGAYFHDIGKINKPDYFAENQGADPSKHDALSPTMSTLIIVAHAKDGLELADEYALPKPVKGIIAEHHGTTLVEYFFAQAKDRKNNGDGPKEEAFRYPGPKPLAKESAIVLMADAVESSSRTLTDPVPSRVENLVYSIIQTKMRDGQLDRSNLTLNEIHRIENSFAKTLTSIHHGRVKYPGQQENGDIKPSNTASS